MGQSKDWEVTDCQAKLDLWNIQIALVGPLAAQCHRLHTIMVDDDEIILTAHNQEGASIGTVRVQRIEHTSQEVTLIAEPTYFDQTSAVFVRQIDSAEFAEFIDRFAVFFAQSGPFYRSELQWPPPEYLPLEMLFQFWRLYTQAPSEYDRELLQEVLEQFGPDGFFMIWGMETVDDIQVIDSMAVSSQAETSTLLLGHHIHLIRRIDEIENRLQNPDKRLLHHQLQSLVLGVFQATVQNYREFMADDQQEVFDTEVVQQAYQALWYLLARAFELPDMPVDPPKITDALDELLQRVSHSPEKFKQAQPIIEALLAHSQTLEDRVGFREKSLHFYQVLGEVLRMIASETTGDTTQELAILDRLLTEILVKTDRAGKPWRMLDAGSSDQQRIALPLYRLLAEKQLEPNQIIAIDREEFVVPSDEMPTQFYLHDLSEGNSILPPGVDSGFVIIAQWSVINDNLPTMQEAILKNFSRSLEVGGYVLLEYPTYQFYREAIQDYASRNLDAVPGAMSKEFGVKHPKTGEVIKAEIEITASPTGVLAGYAAKAGLVPATDISLPGMTNGVLVYRTAQGQERAFMVLKKVGEPSVSTHTLLPSSR